MLILGINAYHGDSSACLLRDGEIIAAAEEERFRRIKHWAGFPSESIRYCLSAAGATVSDVEHVAVNSDPSAHLGKKLAFVLANRPSIKTIMDRVRNQAKRQSIEAELGKAFPSTPFKGKVHRVEHHVAHLASTFLVSPFKEASVVSVDGFGDFSSAAWGLGSDNSIGVEGRVYFPHSLGVFYQALTQFIGFSYYGDEYKIMGLAPYGRPTYLPQMREIVHLLDDGSFALNLKYFRHHNEKVAYEWEGGSPHVGTLFSPELEQLLGPARSKDDELTQVHKDIAFSVQAMYEEAFFHLLDKLHKKHGADAVTLSGGCAMNSVANGKVRRRSPYKRVYIQSAAGDAGGAIGAAVHVWYETLKGASPDAKANGAPLEADADLRRPVMTHAYLGPSYDDAEVSKLLQERDAEIKAAGCTVERMDTEQALFDRTAALIADGNVVGWFQGRLEWGPRALGNRSIVCDPRRADMKDILNRKIKRRESFRPFAPSILKEHVAGWFEEDGDVPFMMQVYQIAEDKRPQLPAVTHADGSGRLQTVYKETNPRYWGLIEAFRQKTGVPMVLNTSFNENEPVVCKPQEALDCFIRTNMDLLVLGDWMIYRKQ